MGSQALYEFVLGALAVYVVLGLCIIGRPSLAVAFGCWIQSVTSRLTSTKVPSRVRAWAYPGVRSAVNLQQARRGRSTHRCP